MVNLLGHIQVHVRSTGADAFVRLGALTYLGGSHSEADGHTRTDSALEKSSISSTNLQRIKDINDRSFMLRRIKRGRTAIMKRCAKGSHLWIVRQGRDCILHY